MPDDFLKTSFKNANHDSTYLILGLLITSICNPGLVDPYIDESSLPCVRPPLLDRCPASDCKAAFEDVHAVTGLSSKRGSLRPWGVNKPETIIKQSIFVTVWHITSSTSSQKHRMFLSKRFDNYINVHLLTKRHFFLCGFSTSQTCTCVFVDAFSAWVNSYILLRILHKINLVGQTTEEILHLVWSSPDKALHEFRLDILHVLQ